MSEHVFRCRKYQRALHENWSQLKKDRFFEIAHRRWGKDEIALNVTRDLALQRKATYWHCLPEYAQARKALWNAVNAHTGKRRIDEAFPPEIVSRRSEQEMFIELVNGSTWQLIGSDKYDSTVGAGPAGIVYSEWALANPAAWAYHRPMVEENNGWSAFITTPRGKNHAHSMLKRAQQSDRWFAEVSSVTQTGALTSEQLREALEEYQDLYGADAGRAFYEQEYLCSFEAAILGAYFGAEMRQAQDDGRITNVPRDGGAPVHTAWDIGIDDSTAIWFAQVIGREVRVIDYYENSGMDAAHYAGVLREKSYTYGDHMLPHDAGKREIGTGLSYEQQLGRAEIPGKTRIIPRTNDLVGDINQTRAFISTCYFDEKRCGQGIEALRQYRREWDEKKKTWGQRPLHDWSSHAADAFRQLAIGIKPKSKVKSKPRRRPTSAWAA